MVVDTSALMAIALDESLADACMAALEAEAEPLISAVTVAEALIVALGRDVRSQMGNLLDGFGFEVVPVAPGFALRVARAYEQWGRGMHPARLNLGDCFSYALAKERGCGLLYVGDDFGRTDVVAVLR
jgi:ribonuclease VapC